MELAIGNRRVEIGGSGESATASTFGCPGMVGIRGAAHASIGAATTRVTGPSAIAAAVRAASIPVSAPAIAAVGAAMVATTGKPAAVEATAAKASTAVEPSSATTVATAATMLGLSWDRKANEC